MAQDQIKSALCHLPSFAAHMLILLQHILRVSICLIFASRCDASCVGDCIIGKTDDTPARLQLTVTPKNEKSRTSTPPQFFGNIPGYEGVWHQETMFGNSDVFIHEKKGAISSGHNWIIYWTGSAWRSSMSKNSADPSSATFGSGDQYFAAACGSGLQSYSDCELQLTWIGFSYNVAFK